MSDRKIIMNELRDAGVTQAHLDAIASCSGIRRYAKSNAKQLSNELDEIVEIVKDTNARIDHKSGTIAATLKQIEHRIERLSDALKGAEVI